MAVAVTPIGPHFVAKITGVDLTGPIADDDFAVMRRALDDHGVLIIPSIPLTDAQQISFSNRWGPMEPTKGVNPASGTPFARQSNLDINTGDVIPATDRRMDYQKGNYQWHADSTFKAVPSLCSILSAREVPPQGGNTEFASTRNAYRALPQELKAQLEALIVEHDFSVSRGRVGFTFSAEEAQLTPPVWHPLVQTNPVTGEKSLLIGAHASQIVGWSVDKGHALLEDLLARATRAEVIHSHHWSDGDVVIWDNRSALHRATAYDTNGHRRLMQRTTIGNPHILDSAPYVTIRRSRAAQG
ncbi:MAG: alpha-ketoglutarate-dependent 2,4-dichlorophenoxyacetate dioxygenase [Gammaproteobacteria bacterium]|jgi:alpha-ketoglutarate-dependent 2,4-dichlorophenoxyacetate dioxygenase